MKRIASLLVLALLFSCTAQEPKPEPKTVVGMFTPYYYFPEILNGKVKNLKEVNYWAKDDNGTITAGMRITVADRDSLINWTDDIDVSFDENGNVVTSLHLDENDQPFGQLTVTLENGKPTGASWMVKDTIRNYSKFTYDGEMISRFDRYNAQTDSLLASADVTYNDMGMKETLQWYNADGEKTFLVNFNYDMDGLAESYTASRNDTVRIKMSFVSNEEGFFKEQTVEDMTSNEIDSYTYDYTYDDMGNWISYIAYEDGKPTVVAKRTYTYYTE
ncbi:hypothetical protein ACUNWD_20530 [Sunxiuqinia sp. A32]|uniref:hypothetical protein n=1 Tax=Sunxiuqinia sp. A32 TaxID=3461496 RepID=UPI0040466C40